MWLYKPQNSQYYKAAWRDPKTGRVVTRTTKTADRKLATQRARTLEREHDAASGGLPAYPLEEALNTLIAEKVRNKRSAATLEITRCKCGHLLRVLGKRRDVTTFTLEDSKNYLDQRRSEGAHDHTILKELAQLLQALRIAHAATPQRFDRDPRTIWPRAALQNAYVPQDTYWTLEQYERAQACGIASRVDHVAIYCHCGVRYGELYRIEARHVDLAGRRVFVDGTKSNHTKKRAAKRWVPLDDTALEVMRRRVEMHPTGLLFPDRWSRGRLFQDMKRVAKRAGVPAMSANDFRRTFATWCGEAGVDERTCYVWMGHTSGTMIRRVYQQMTERRSAAQGALLTAFLGVSKGVSEAGTNTAQKDADHAAE